MIDAEWPESTQKDDKGVWVGAPTGGYRVHDVQVYNKETGAYEPLDLEGKYNLAGYNYTLRDLGDGFNMFSSAVNVLDYVAEDYMVLANYVQGFEGGAGTLTVPFHSFPPSETLRVRASILIKRAAHRAARSL